MLHTDALTHRCFYAKKFLPTDVFIHRCFAPRCFCAHERKHTGVFTLVHKLHVKVFTHRKFRTQKLYPEQFFPHRNLYAQKFLRTAAFIDRRFLHTDLFRTKGFTHRNFYTQMLLHTDAFSKKNMTQKTVCSARFYTQPVFTHRFGFPFLITYLSCTPSIPLSVSRLFFRDAWMYRASPFSSEKLGSSDARVKSQDDLVYKMYLWQYTISKYIYMIYHGIFSNWSRLGL